MEVTQAIRAAIIVSKMINHKEARFRLSQVSWDSHIGHFQSKILESQHLRESITIFRMDLVNETT